MGLYDEASSAGLPDCRGVCRGDREVEQMGKITQTHRPEMLQVQDCKTIGAGRCRIFRLPDGIGRQRRREGSKGSVEWICLLQIFKNSTSRGTGFMGRNLRESFTETVGDSGRLVTHFPVKLNRLIWRGNSFLIIGTM